MSGRRRGCRAGTAPCSLRGAAPGLRRPGALGGAGPGHRARPVRRDPGLERVRQDQPAQGAARRAAADQRPGAGSAASRSGAAAPPSATCRSGSRSTSGTMLKARDLVRMGLDGHRWGLPFGSGALAAGRPQPGSTSCWPRSAPPASATPRSPCCPAASCSGSGSRRRWRPNPSILLCDEPLAALDLRHQQEVAALLDRRRREHGTAVLFVTHDINAVLRLRRPGAVPGRRSVPARHRRRGADLGRA